MMKDSAVAPPAAGNSSSNNSNSSSRRPRAQSMQHFGDKCSVPRECCSSGSFVSKLYRMVDSEPSTIVSWIRGTLFPLLIRVQYRDMDS